MMIALKEAINSGLLGKIVDFDAWLALDTPWSLWKFLENLPRVEILLHSIHYFDFIRSILGDPNGVKAKTLGFPGKKTSNTRTAAILDYGKDIRCALTINHNHSFGRKFPYIRMSITEVCNFKCGYCLPNGYQVDKSDNRKFLNIDEIRRLAKGFSELGVQKIRLTGGEPTVMKDFYEIVKILKNETSIKKIVITTNGYHLDQKAKLLIDSGLDGINISIDSLDRETFKNITKHDRLPEILKGIEILQSLNFDNIKINAVLLNGVNSSKKDFDSWAEYIKNNFLVTTKHELAILHNDRSPLENMHCATLYDVLKNDVRCPCFPCHGPRLTIAPLLVLRTCPSHRTSTSSRS